MKDWGTVIAVLLPIAACALIGWRFCKQDKGSWQLAACFAALVIATSIFLLAASGGVSFVRLPGRLTLIGFALHAAVR